MSVDVGYYLFSEKRANKNWEIFQDDIETVKKYKTLSVSENYLLEEYTKVEEENSRKDEEDEKKLQTIRERVYRLFEERGYFLEGKTDWEESDGDTYTNMDALVDYCSAYPNGLKNKGGGQLLHIEFPELSREYVVIKVMVRQRLLDNLEKRSRNIRNPKHDLTQTQQYIFDRYESHFSSDEDLEDIDRVSFLKMLDLECGSVSVWNFEEPKIEQEFLDVVVNVAKLKNIEGLPLASEWVRFFKMQAKVFDSCIDEFHNFFKSDRQEASDMLIGYLQTVKPLIKDFQENSDAVFYECMVALTKWSLKCGMINLMNVLKYVQKNIKTYLSKLKSLLDRVRDYFLRKE